MKKSVPPPVVSHRGRPSNYDPKFVLVVKAMAYTGATNQQIAEFLNISIRTFERWKRKYPEFKKALEARKYGNAEVILALFERAIGGEYNEITKEIHLEELVDRQGNVLKVMKRVTKERHRNIKILPDIRAIEIWLNNRDRGNWNYQDEHPDSSDHVKQLMRGRELMVENNKRLAEKEKQLDEAIKNARAGNVNKKSVH